MIDIIKENINDSEKKELINNYENTLKEVNKYVDNKINEIIASIQNLKDTIKYNIVTEEISSFYVDEKSLALDESNLDDEIESEQLIKEINNFSIMTSNDMDYIIEDGIMELFK